MVDTVDHNTSRPLRRKQLKAWTVFVFNYFVMRKGEIEVITRSGIMNFDNQNEF